MKRCHQAVKGFRVLDTIDRILLKSGGHKAVVSVAGAELLSWQTDGRELMWKRDPDIWDGVAPILFPVVGWCRNGRIIANDKWYPMPVHGFAASSRFELQGHEVDRAVFVLNDSEVTRRHFPFAFCLTVTYRLAPSGLDIVLNIHNNGAELLPYACGVHPGFALASEGNNGDQCFIIFEKDENPAVPQISGDGLFKTASRRIPLEGKNLPVKPELFAQDALCFLNANSKSVKLVQGGKGMESRRAIQLTVEDFAHLAAWSKPHAPFVCLEAWTGHGDPENFDGDIFSKPGTRCLIPGETGRHRVHMAYIPSAPDGNEI